MSANDLKVSLALIQQRLDTLLGDQPHINAGLLASLQPLLNRASVLAIIEDVLHDESLAAEIAARSYTHTLGFNKIVLLDPGCMLSDGRRGYGYQLRLHIWQAGADGAVPLVESMHEHSFDFISHMLTGDVMENQCYRMQPLTPADSALAARFIEALMRLSNSDKHGVNKQLEALEAERLRPYASQQADTEGLLAIIDRAWLMRVLALESGDLDFLVALQGRYQAVAPQVEAGSYVHKLTEMIKLGPHGVLRLHPGDTYHHGHDFAHRLYIRAGQPNSTMLVTTPVSQDAMGGSFQRPSWVPGADVAYARRMYTARELQDMLAIYKKELLAQVEPAHTRLLDVASP